MTAITTSYLCLKMLFIIDMSLRVLPFLCIFMPYFAAAATLAEVQCEFRMLGISVGEAPTASFRDWQRTFAAAQGELKLATSSAPWHLVGIEGINTVEIIHAESLVGQIVAGVVNHESRAESIVHTFIGRVLSVENLSRPGNRPFYSASILEAGGQVRQIMISLASPLRVRLDASPNPSYLSSATWVDGAPSDLSGILRDVLTANRSEYEGEMYRAKQRLAASTRNPNLWRAAGTDLPNGTSIEEPDSLVGRFIAGVMMVTVGRHEVGVSTFGGKVLSILDLSRSGGPKFYSATLETPSGTKSVLISLANPLRVYIGP